MAIIDPSGSRRTAQQTSSSLTLKRARLRLALRPTVILGGVSAVFTGPNNRSIRFTFVPKRRNPDHGIETIEFELPRAEAWALSEWLYDEATKRSPVQPKKR
jgi:hypothetical protein